MVKYLTFSGFGSKKTILLRRGSLDGRAALPKSHEFPSFLPRGRGWESNFDVIYGDRALFACLGTSLEGRCCRYLHNLRSLCMSWDLLGRQILLLFAVIALTLPISGQAWEADLSLFTVIALSWEADLSLFMVIALSWEADLSLFTVIALSWEATISAFQASPKTCKGNASYANSDKICLPS